jgi:CheY-like chemotaxis protein
MGRVLVVEDEPAVRRVLCESIAGLGHEAAEAGDGMEALERFRGGRYDAVVTDLAMPRMDGIELARRLKALDPGVAVLMVTGEESLDVMVRAVNLGISDYLRKPFPLATFARTVERALPRGGPRPGRRRASARTAARWALLAVSALAVLLAWRVWQQEAGLRALARRVDRFEEAAP